MSKSPLYIGKRHYDKNGNPIGGIKVEVEGSNVVEIEGGEMKICRSAYESDEVLDFKDKTNKQILDYIHNEFACKFEQDKANSGDFILCRLVVLDQNKHNRKGTVKQILDEMQDEKSCRISIGSNSMQQGGKLTDKEIQERWEKKKEHVQQLSQKIRSIRYNLTRDINSSNEKDFLTALAISLMDKTAERVGNEVSKINKRYGITGLMKKHVKIDGNTVYLNYVGKSGVEHDKQFSDAQIADALRVAIKNSPSQYIFVTSDNFKVKADRINRYLNDFGVTAKDIRGYSANKWLSDKLNNVETIEETKRKRKTQFNKLLKAVAKKVGHGAATLKKHYLIPELEYEFVENGKIIDLSNFYKKGGYVRIAQTPAPPKERIYGSETNKAKSSESLSSAKNIKFDDATLDKIASLVDKHNDKNKTKKVTLDAAKAVVRRGMGAYSVSHRPTIKGNKPNSRVAWGLARLNAFLYKAEHGVSKSGRYTQDDDLLEELKIKHKKMEDGGIIKSSGLLNEVSKIFENIFGF